MSFFSAVGNWFKKLFQHAPSWSQSASTALTLASPLVTTLVTLLAGSAAGAETANVLAEIKSDMAAAAALVSQSHSSTDPGVIGTLQATLTAINTNLSAVEAAIHVKDPNSAAKVSEAVTAITGEISAILSVLPATTQSAT